MIGVNMSDASVIKTTFPSRSMGLKLMVVSVLAVVMTIPALFVWSLIEDRTQRAAEVVNEVSGLVGGAQTFLGPVIAVPYIIPASPVKAGERGVYVIFPARAEAIAGTKTEVRHRSLFKVPVYRSDITFNASFDLAGVPAYAPAGALLDWGRAEFLVGASDARGAKADAMITIAGKTETFVPAAALDSLRIDLHGSETQLSLFGAPAAGIAEPNSKFDATAVMKFSGAQRFAILAFGKTTTVAVKGDWPHPGFNGGFLPAKQTITPQGFEADWSVPFIARGVPSEGSVDTITRLGRTAMGVSFVELADPYQSVTRSLKYAVLFIGLVFLSYFLFEISTGKRVHPAQYMLVGIAQIVFYLLLLSIAEHTGFDAAFAIAAIATVALISTYAGWVFESRKYGLRASVIFALLYGLIYVLLGLEDQALLVGAIASFVAIAAVMYFTRRMDWYSSAGGVSHPPLSKADRAGEPGSIGAT
jgi:inner membrane protein